MESPSAATPQLLESSLLTMAPVGSATSLSYAWSHAAVINDEHDVLNVELATSNAGAEQYQQTIEKFCVRLWITWIFYRQVEKKSLLVPALQIICLEAEVLVAKLVAPGLYVAERLHWLLIPRRPSHLKQLRKIFNCLLFVWISYTHGSYVWNAHPL